MSIVEKVLSDSLYVEMTKNLSEKERNEVESVVKNMLGNIDNLHSSILSNISDEQGANKFLDELLYLFNNKEGVEKWQEKP